jgi:hypothetical protein
MSPGVPTPFCFSTGPDGTQRPTSTAGEHHANLAALAGAQIFVLSKKIWQYSCSNWLFNRVFESY